MTDDDDELLESETPAGVSDGGNLTLTVPQGVFMERADKLLAAHFPQYSRARLQEVFDEGKVFLDGKPASKKTRVSEGAVLTLTEPAQKIAIPAPVDIPLDILYEDEHIVVVNKRPGMVVHPGNATGEDTMVHALLHHTKGNLTTNAGEIRPGVVHRLDKETSGVIIFAKSDRAYRPLTRAFASRKLDKQYLALTRGAPALLSGVLRGNIDRHPTHRTRMAVRENEGGKPARTDWAVEKHLGKNFSFLRLWLHTGRTHQIRTHLSHMGFPILGDALYGDRPLPNDPWKAPRVMLHAERLTITHPVTKEEMTFIAPLPEDFKQGIAAIEKDFGEKE